MGALFFTFLCSSLSHSFYPASLSFWTTSYLEVSPILSIFLPKRMSDSGWMRYLHIILLSVSSNYCLFYFLLTLIHIKCDKWRPSELISCMICFVPLQLGGNGRSVVALHSVACLLGRTVWPCGLSLYNCRPC